MRIRKNYLLVLLTVIMVFNYLDRLAVGLLLQDIKLDLSLSDTQLGFLTGISFAFFYAVMGIPIARWADRGNRVTIIALTTALWSVAVALCGAATSFVQLLVIRIGVAVGEAGCHPPALSLLSDHFTRAERPRAVSNYMLGWPVALVVGNVAAGWLNELYGWRATFVILGLPGLILAALALVTLREPRRSGMKQNFGRPVDTETTVQPPQPSLRDVFVTLWGNAAFRHILIGFSVLSFFTSGITQWQPAFFIRSHGLDTGELGTWLAVVYGVGGLLGTYLGGELAFRYAASNERLQLRAIAVVFAGFAAVTAAVYLSPDHRVAFVMLGISAIGGAATNGPLFAAIQTLVQPRMRAMSIALVFFFSNLIGGGGGPLVVGALSDALRPWLAEESLRYALLAFCPGLFLVTWQFWQASGTVGRDMAIVENAERYRPG